MADNQIDEIVSIAIEKIKSVSEINTIVGEPIVISNITMLPITKLSVGFVAGGGEYGARTDEIKKTKAYPFSGGTGGGISVQPVGFLCINGKDVKFIRVDGRTPYDKIIESLPALAHQVVEGIRSIKNDK